MHLPIILSCEKSGNKNVETKALLDTGAGGKFIDQNFVLQNNIRTYKLAKPITVYNVDGMENKMGTITRYVDVNLQIGNRTTATKLLVTGLGRQKIILGFPWFEEQNLEINWKTWTKTSYDDYKKMIYTWNQLNVNSRRQRLNISEWSLKKERSLWILSRLKDYGIGQHRLLWRKYNPF